MTEHIIIICYWVTTKSTSFCICTHQLCFSYHDTDEVTPFLSTTNPSVRPEIPLPYNFFLPLLCEHSFLPLVSFLSASFLDPSHHHESLLLKETKNYLSSKQLPHFSNPFHSKTLSKVFHVLFPFLYLLFSPQSNLNQGSINMA